MAARIYVTTRSFALEFTNKIPYTVDFMYKPTTSSAIGIGLNLPKLGLAAAIKTGVDEGQQGIYGKTKYFDVQSNSYGKRYGFDVHFQRYRGFYLDEPWLLDSTWRSGQAFPQRADLRAISTCFNLLHWFNPNYSMRASFLQTEKQDCTVASFLFLLSASNNLIRADSSLLPYANRVSLANYLPFRSGNFSTLAMAPGASLTLASQKSLYATVFLCIGPAFQYQWLKVDAAQADYTMRKFKLEPYLNTRLSLGWNGPQTFAGLFFIVNTVQSSFASTQINSTSINFRVFVGTRFPYPNWLKKRLARRNETDAKS